MKSFASHLGERLRSRFVNGLPFALSVLWVLLNIFIFGLGMFGEEDLHPQLPQQVYSHGIQILTDGRLTPGPVGEAIALLLVLASLRLIAIRLRLFFRPGLVEVRALDNASDSRELDTHPLDVAFREYLTLPRLYQVTTIPGDPDPDHLIEILRTPANSGWRETLAATFAYVFPRRTFIVSATLRTRDHPYHRYGVSVQVRKLPGPAVELEAQWSGNFDRALRRAAYAVGAYVLPSTRRCRSVPWSAWRGRTLPVPLFRDYQRAKKMVAERRFDESLDLYFRALLQDATNVGLRYDIGQLYERLGLFADALFTYLRLINEIFPARRPGLVRRSSHASQQTDANRVLRPRWWPEPARDPFIIRYRYVVELGLGTTLASELCAPDWRELRRWIARPHDHDVRDETIETRPWRAIELVDLRRRLSDDLDRLFPSARGERGAGPTLNDRIEAFEKETADDLRNERSHDVERYLLRCAQVEVDGLERSFRASNRIRFFMVLTRAQSPLTVTAIRQESLFIQYRQKRLDFLQSAAGRKLRAQVVAGHDRGWPTVEMIDQDLSEIKYDWQSSNWLEHYNAACLFALPLLADKRDEEVNRLYAFRSVAALERAMECGEDVDFVKAKRYWLQAGDPDLVGLRRYDCFRAFEARVYGRPMPAAPDLARYELYLYLRAMLEYGSERIEAEWRRRATLRKTDVTGLAFEEWWRQEEHAWELAIRLGRFYRQWQTRRSAAENLRNWIESFGDTAWPIAYPDLVRSELPADTTNYARVNELLISTEAIFSYLGANCGRLWQAPARQDANGLINSAEENGSTSNTRTIIDLTREWAKCAWRLSEASDEAPIMTNHVRKACLERAAVWAALRHWVMSPGNAGAKSFEDSISRLRGPNEH